MWHTVGTGAVTFSGSDANSHANPVNLFTASSLVYLVERHTFSMLHSNMVVLKPGTAVWQITWRTVLGGQH